MNKNKEKKAKKVEEQDINGEILFLNTPIAEQEQDVIGVEKYVDKLDAALDMGAQMIAITAPFGSGKTSVIELLEKRRLKKKGKKNERIIKLSMWSQLHGETGSTNELHKSFIYQLASQINHKRGTYISRRLSPNYGLLKMHANKACYWVLFIIAISLLAMCWAINSFEDDITSYLTFLEDNLDTWKTGMALVGAVLGLIVVTRAEIIYSSIKGNDEKRHVESAEIIDLYRDEILKYPVLWFKKILFKKMHYVVVIEDLDRTSDAKAVVDFLKELRKYYVIQANSGKEGKKYRNKVSFIVNVKPEALLECKEVVPNDINKDVLEDKQENVVDKEKESLYAKLFDYVLNLQTINIDNYDAVLAGVLDEKRTEIRNLGLSVGENLIELQGMKWIIRERRLGIREIKERLNIAFSLYESLVKKFGRETIAFEKCAVVAYLTTAYEKEFYKTTDRAFQELVNLYLQRKLTEETCGDCLKGTSEEYIRTVKELVEAKHIDSSYRTYFYNYPKGSYLYTSDELQINDAILYGENVGELEQVAQRVVSQGSLVPQRALQTLKQLGLPVPATVFQSETLYVIALKREEERVLHYIENMDYSTESLQKNNLFFKRIISYDKAREVYTKEVASKLCSIWEEKLSENAIGQLRLALCKDFPAEIMWYHPLFFGVHAIISEEEMELLSFEDAISLIDFEDEEFDFSWPEYVQKRFAKQQVEESKVESFLRSAEGYIESSKMAMIFLEFMGIVGRIVPDYEDKVFECLQDKSILAEMREDMFAKYQDLINGTADCLSAKTLEYISGMDRYDGYSYAVAVRLNEGGYHLDYVLILLDIQKPIPFEMEDIQNCMNTNVEWLCGKERTFIALRKQLCACSEELLGQYMFMFSEDCPAISGEEIQILQEHHENSEELVMELLPPELVNEDNFEMLCTFFNRKKQMSATQDILAYISDMEPSIAQMSFLNLNFDNIRYQFLSKDKKAQVKKWYEDILSLDTADGKLSFMKTTKYLDSDWEAELLDDLKKDSALKEEYIKIVNSVDKITKSTVSTVCKLGVYCSMSSLMNEKLFESKKYIEYVVSTTLGKRRFDIEEENRDVLWQTYVKIFSGAAYQVTRKYMVQNTEFVRLVMESKSYQGFDEENRMQLVGVYQDRECLEDVLEYGDEFALEYYSSIAGFVDEEAATTFVSIVEANDALLDSDELYVKTHGMLVNGRLKARYTNARKRRGHMRE